VASRHLHIINEQSEKFTFHNNRGSSNIDLTITNNNLIADVHEWEISDEENCSDHNFLKYKIGKANSYKNKYNYHGIRYIVKDEKYYEYDQKLELEIPKILKNIIYTYKGCVEEMDMNLSKTAAKDNDLQRLVDSFTEVMQTACTEAFKIINTQNKTKQKKSVPWWTDSLTITRKRINALRRLYQKTRNNEKLRETWKHNYLEEKKKYQCDIRKEKLNSWKEYCNVAPSLNPWSHVNKLATGKVRTNSIVTTPEI